MCRFRYEGHWQGNYIDSPLCRPGYERSVRDIGYPDGVLHGVVRQHVGWQYWFCSPTRFHHLGGGGPGIAIGGSVLTRTTLLAVTEDWFALSHFQPLIEVLRESTDRLVLVTNLDRGADKLRSLGVDVLPFNFSRASINPIRQADVLRRLVQTILDIRPDTVHFIALQTIVTGALALRIAGVRPRTCYHLTGAGFLVTGTGFPREQLKWPMLKLIQTSLARPSTMLFVENLDDAQLLTGGRHDLMARVHVIPGAGVDPDAFPALPPTGNAVPVISYVGRMLRSKGVFVLAEASRRLTAAAIRADVRMYGPVDSTPDAVSETDLSAWTGGDGQPHWMGPTRDVVGVWRHSDICAMVPLGGDGMPRAMLEAASCGRPIIASDVPGCRHFVEDRLNGIVVRPGDGAALFDAICHLIQRPDEARRMGQEARARLVAHYSVDAVQSVIRNAYGNLHRGQ